MAEDGTRLLEELMRFKPDGLTANAWAVQAGVGRTIWADLRRHGNPSRRTLAKLLEAAGSSLAEFEALRVGSPAETAGAAGQLAEAGNGWRQAPPAPLPVVRTEPDAAGAEGGQNIARFTVERAEVVDRLPRPASLAADRDAYAITIVGESMWPRFRSGRRVAVSPSLSIAPGDDVLAILSDGHGAMIGELLSRTSDAIRLRQFNPSAELTLPAGRVNAIHKVLGELI